MEMGRIGTIFILTSATRVTSKTNLGRAFCLRSRRGVAQRAVVVRGSRMKIRTARAVAEALLLGHATSGNCAAEIFFPPVNKCGNTLCSVPSVFQVLQHVFFVDYGLPFFLKRDVERRKMRAQITLLIVLCFFFSYRIRSPVDRDPSVRQLYV